MNNKNISAENIERMKKLIEEKKQKGRNSKNDKKAEKVIGRVLLHSGRSTL